MTLRTTKGGLHRNGPRARLFLDDVEEICQLIVQAGDAPKIFAGSHSADEPNDFLLAPETALPEVVIKGDNYSVEITTRGTEIRAKSSDPASIGVVSEAERVLRARRQTLTTRLSSGWWSFLGLVLIGAALWILWSTSRPGLALAVEAVGTAMLWWPTLIRRLRDRGGVFVPRKRNDALPFWDRNREQIAISVGFLAVGTVLGAFVTKLTS